MTWLLAYSSLGLQTVPEESLRENKIIFVSANRPEDIESFNACRRGSVWGAIASTQPVHASQIQGAAPLYDSYDLARVECVAGMWLAMRLN